jgi:hypothetical protein
MNSAVMGGRVGAHRHPWVKRLLVLSLFSVGAFNIHCPAQTVSPGAQDPFVGRWRWAWTGGGPIVVEIQPNGTAHTDGGLKGHWKFVPSETNERNYDILWGGGRNEDSVALSTSGQQVTGHSVVFKARIWAARIK